MKRHSTDAVSLVFGLIFLGVAGWWLLAGAIDLAASTVAWLAALVLVLGGGIGLFVTLRAARHSRD